jgi:hypothetical protein
MEKLKVFIMLAVVAAGIYVAWSMVPPYFHNYQFQDDLDDVVRINSYLARTDEDIKAQVIKKALNEDISLKEDQITVTRGGEGLGISVRYRIHVDMMVHPVDIDFTANSKNKRI